MPEFERFLDGLAKWLSDHGIEATYKVDQDKAEVALKEDGEDFYIGNYAEPGMLVVWLGFHEIGGKEENLVRVNGITMSALGKHVAAWVIGYE